MLIQTINEMVNQMINQMNIQVINQMIIQIMYEMQARPVWTWPRPRDSSKYEYP